jgi:SAM-dependent methyltransferase
MLRINLASGTDLKRGDGWVNLDAVSWKLAGAPPDVFWNAKDPIPFPDGSADEVYCGYTFLHIPLSWHERLLAECRRVLKPGGTLMVGEVDMAILMPRWLANPSDPYLSGLLWGEAGSVHGEDMAQWDNHAQGFTEQSLRDFLARGGFPIAERVSIHHKDVWFELTLVARK